ncbi:MAG: CotH kinase family protein [Polyangiaceae bacterium]
MNETIAESQMDLGGLDHWAGAATAQRFRRMLMNHRFACSAVLLSLCLALGCGGAADGDSQNGGTGGRGSGGSTAFAGTPGVGGSSTSTQSSGNGGSSTSTSSTTAVTEWRYETTDEGVFPKDRVLDIQVKMSDEAWTRLIATAKQEVWSTAEVTIDGQSVGMIGIRPKGEYSLDSCVDDRGQLICEKLSLKLKFNEVDADGRFYGLKRLALNQILDGAAVFKETLAYHIFNSFGVTAPRTSYATVSLNGKSLGMYTVVEMIDGRFTDMRFDNGSGNLYKRASAGPNRRRVFCRSARNQRGDCR